jgi:chaperone modulatory protein CbpM
MKTTIVTAEVFDEDYRISLDELREMLNIEDDFLEQLFDFGLIEPIDTAEPDLVLDATAFQRIHTAIRLQRDLNINIEGIALALELLDELNELRNKIQILEKMNAVKLL